MKLKQLRSLGIRLPETSKRWVIDKRPPSIAVDQCIVTVLGFTFTLYVTRPEHDGKAGKTKRFWFY